MVLAMRAAVQQMAGQTTDVMLSNLSMEELALHYHWNSVPTYPLAHTGSAQPPAEHSHQKCMASLQSMESANVVG
jgi:hypothetical protein